MAVEVWDSVEFLKQIREHADKEFSELDTEDRANWTRAVNDLLIRAHARGDGVAVYENADLSSREIGQFQIVSYGGPDAQLETRNAKHFESTRETLGLFKHRDDELPKTLPDIGGQINWRYTLKAVVPSSDVPCSHEGCVYREGHDLTTFPHRVEEEEPTYKIVRLYRDDRPKEVRETGLTLEEAQAHCKSDDTHGDDWFDGYEAE